MKWYSKYIQVYEKPFVSAPQQVTDFVRNKLQKLPENR